MFRVYIFRNLEVRENLRVTDVQLPVSFMIWHHKTVPSTKSSGKYIRLCLFRFTYATTKYHLEYLGSLALPQTCSTPTWWQPSHCHSQGLIPLNIVQVEEKWQFQPNLLRSQTLVSYSPALERNLPQTTTITMIIMITITISPDPKPSSPTLLPWRGACLKLLKSCCHRFLRWLCSSQVKATMSFLLAPESF